MTDPWDDCWYIYPLIYHTNQPNIGEYTVRPMDPSRDISKNISPNLTYLTLSKTLGQKITAKTIRKPFFHRVYVVYCEHNKQPGRNTNL